MKETYNQVIGNLIIEGPEKEGGIIANLFSMNSGIDDIRDMVSAVVEEGEIRAFYRETGASNLLEVGAGLDGEYTLVTLVGEGDFNMTAFKSLVNASEYSLKDSRINEEQN